MVPDVDTVIGALVLVGCVLVLRLRDNKVTVDMATTIIEMIVGANMVAALARYPHQNPLNKSESGHVSEQVKTEQVTSS